MRLFLAGDVMIGRGIDQLMVHSVDPQLFERYVDSATAYVELAERKNGAIPRPVGPDYVWGDALATIEDAHPDCRIVNLETALTTNPSPWPGKTIHYRAHPANVAVLTVAHIDCCTLANNHTLDWGEAGLHETLDTLHECGIATSGAGGNNEQAQAPAILKAGEGRVIVAAFGSTTAYEPVAWLAGPRRPGLSLTDGWSTAICSKIADRVGPIRRPGDVLVVSVHWGSNWGQAIPGAQRHLAHALVDVAGADVVFGHSSHHPRPIEIYRDRLIVYGSGDFINDYEGISGYEEYRSDLHLGWFVDVDPATGQTASVTMAPFQMRRLRLARAAIPDVAWLARTLDRSSQPFGVRVDATDAGKLRAYASR